MLRQRQEITYKIFKRYKHRLKIISQAHGANFFLVYFFAKNYLTARFYMCCLIKQSQAQALRLPNINYENERKRVNMKFYFTYGTSEQYPFQGGWTVVTANDLKSAIQLFRIFHPDINDGILNCADYYTREQFIETDMFKNKDNLGSGCNECIDISSSVFRNN